MSGNEERTFIMLKVDGVQRGLIGEIIARFERKGYKLVALKFLKPSLDLVKQHYQDLSAKPFYDKLCNFMSSGPVAAMVWEGLNATGTGRQMLGETDPQKSAPGTIRGDYSIHIGRNICHGSDSVESAKKEISLWFKEDELVTWKQTSSKWIYE